MRYLLDSDTVNYLMKEHPGVKARFRQALSRNDRFVRCPVVHLEVTRYQKLRGSSRLLRFYASTTARWRRYDFRESDWDLAADLWGQRARVGRPIADADLLIAVCALRTGAVLVTNNVDHFEGLGLTVENWAQE